MKYRDTKHLGYTFRIHGTTEYMVLTEDGAFIATVEEGNYQFDHTVKMYCLTKLSRDEMDVIRSFMDTLGPDEHSEPKVVE
jgi:hypothetical protein